MIDIIKKTLTLAVMGAFATLIILGCCQALRQASARSEKQRQQETLVALFGANARFSGQNDSLKYPGTSWKISLPGKTATEYAFAIESVPEAMLPGGIVAMTPAGVVTRVRFYSSFDEKVSLKVLLFSLMTRKRLNQPEAFHGAGNASAGFGQRLIGSSILKPLEIVARIMPDNRTSGVLRSAPPENKIYTEGFEAGLYRQLWNVLQPAAQALTDRTYGSALP